MAEIALAEQRLRAGLNDWFETQQRLDRRFERLTVAYSGGVDSTVLLWLLASAPAGTLPAPVDAIHVNHDLQTSAHDFQRHCERQCLAWGVPLRCVSVAVDRDHAQGLEAAARLARYAAFESGLGDGQWVLTAHHRLDQAETVLLALFRGSGPQGLRGIADARPLGQGWLGRPMLALDKTDIDTLATAQALPVVEDPSNQGLDFDRNYLRHRLYPVLRARWPGAERNIARSAGLQSEAASAIEDLAGLDLARATVAADPAIGAGRTERRVALSLAVLFALPMRRQRAMLRYWLTLNAAPWPGARRLGELLRQLASAGADRSPSLAWQGFVLCRYRDALYLLNTAMTRQAAADTAASTAAAALAWDPRTRPVLILWSGAGSLLASCHRGRGLRLSCLDRGMLIVRARQGGERLAVSGRAGTRSLKRWLQQLGMPPWERKRLPLVYLEDRLVYVPGLGVAAGLEASSGELGLCIEWRPRQPGDEGVSREP